MLGQQFTSKVVAGFVGALLLAAPAMVRAADISDAAGFFSAKAVEDANVAIREIVKKTGHDIRIETHATVPADKAAEVAKMDRKERESYMRKWTLERVDAVKETGALILITKDPAHIETWFSSKLKEAGLTQAERNQISETMLTGFRSKDYDGALKRTVTKFGEVYPKLLRPKSNFTTHERSTQVPAHVNHEPVQARPVAQSNWSSPMILLGMILAGIFVISMISRLFSRGANGYGPQGYQNPGMGGAPGYGGPGYGAPGYGPAGGGGGFMRGLAGGLFGAVAGNWLYNSMSGHSAHAQDAWNNSGLGGGNQNIGDDGNSAGGGWSNDGDFGAGGDFGGSDGGGDFGGGGGDFGGGDFGGGDSGGGDF